MNDTEQLKEYFKVIIDTEMQLYSAEKLSTKIISLSLSGLEAPCRPIPPKRPKKEENLDNLVLALFKSIGFGFLAVLMISLGIWGLVDNIIDTFTVVLFFLLGVIFSIVSIVFATNIKWAKQKIEEQNKAYNEDLKRYFEKKEMHYRNMQNYASKLEDYEKKFAERKDAAINFKRKLLENINELESKLTALYNYGIVYEKYQNWIAICSFLEYFESGRCTSLEGPNGAYNLYEAEKRQNTIIAELSKIDDNLDTIKNNQFELYTSLTTANQNINSVLKDINNQQTIEMFENRINTQIIAASNYLSKY